MSKPNEPATVMLDGVQRDTLINACIAYYNATDNQRALALAYLLAGSDVDVYTTRDKARAFHNKARV